MLRLIEQYLSRVVNILAHFVLFLFFVRFFIVELGIVDGKSMEPSFRDNELFLVNKAGPIFYPLRRFEVVQFFLPTSKNALIIKRVIGFPGETIVIKHNAVYVQDKEGREVELLEPYLYPDLIVNVPYGAANEFLVPSSSYFLLGDNRTSSGDSRDFGPVHRSRIIGKVISL